MTHDLQLRHKGLLLTAAGSGYRIEEGTQAPSLRPHEVLTKACSGSSAPVCAIRPRWPRVVRTYMQGEGKDDGRKAESRGRKGRKEAARGGRRVRKPLSQNRTRRGAGYSVTSEFESALACSGSA